MAVEAVWVVATVVITLACSAVVATVLRIVQQLQLPAVLVVRIVVVRTAAVVAPVAMVA